MKHHILVVEDDVTMSTMLRIYLEKEGHTVTVAADGQTGLEAAVNQPVDLVLLDVMLPRLDGWQVCRQLRERTELPIILLTARDQEPDKVKGLDLGADDYITKPFSMQELLARVRARLRRSPRPAPAEAVLTFPDLEIDLRRRTVVRAGSPVKLTPKEFQLLLELAREPGRVITHDELLKRVWNFEVGTDNHTLRTHVLRLRRKLEVSGLTYVHTVWATGYKFGVDPA